MGERPEWSRGNESSTLGLWVQVFLLVGCVSFTADLEELEAEQSGASKADGDWAPIYGSFVNAEAELGQFVSLTLTEADAEDLPARYYEGAYQLVEATEEGSSRSVGHFNMYAYSGQVWIRFLDQNENEIVTAYERYQVAMEDGVLSLRGGGTEPVFTLMESGLDETVGVRCRLARLESIAGGAEVDSANLRFGGEDFASSEGLAAFAGHYNFDMGMDDDELSVFFYENNHVQDEIGDLVCEIPVGEADAEFCVEPIEVNRNLGTEAELSDYVHAFDFACTFEL